MNRPAFYAEARRYLGSLSTANVIGFELFLTEGERQTLPIDQFAYILATVWWETGKTMQQMREAFWVSHDPVIAEAWRKKHLRYYPYYGRSYPQFTWQRNYQCATDTWNKKYRGDGPEIDFVENPDAIMDPRYGVPLTFDAMREGWFTERKLSDYLDGIDESDAADLAEFKLARKVVNGNDRATEIGKLALVFEKSLKMAKYA